MPFETIFNHASEGLFGTTPEKERGHVQPCPTEMVTDEFALQAMNRGSNRISLRNKWRVDWGGELTRADFVAEIQDQVSSEPVPVSYPKLQKIRTIHHQIAVLLAGGTKAVDIARTLGMTPARIYMLQKDPAFCELLSAYKASSLKDTLNIQARAVGLSTLAMEQLMDKLLEEGEEDQLSPSMLLKISTEMLDRAGYSPQAMAKGVGSGDAPSENQLAAMKKITRDSQEGTVLLRGDSTQEVIVPSGGAATDE